MKEQHTTFRLSFKYILCLHCVGVLTLGLIRIGLLLSNILSGNVLFDFAIVMRAMLKGLIFDNFVATFITAPLLLIASITSIYGKHPKQLKTLVRIWNFTFYSIIITLSIANIRYYFFFDNHLTISSFKWFAFPTETAGLLFGDSHNYIYLIFIAITIYLYIKSHLIVEKKILNHNSYKTENIYIAIPVIIIIYGCVFLGMRGSIQRYPLRISSAYFCDNAFYNRMGINPVFNIIKSIKKDKNNGNELVCDEKKALSYVKNKLNINNHNDEFPLNRDFTFAEAPNKMNVVLILMESMKDENLERKYNGEYLTPFLSGLRDSSYYFSNCYSAAIHTNNGIVASSYGYTPIFAEPSMSAETTPYTGLPYFLKKNGYQTHFFTTSNPNYDYMNSFLRDNLYERIHSLYDYPKEKIVNNFGVADDYLFEYGIKTLDKIHETGKPFLATFLTVSNHSPFIIPEEFKNKGADESEQMIAFADNCIKNFINSAKKSGWYHNTIFVLVGDHGSPTGEKIYDMTLQYNHIPLFIFSPCFNETKKIEEMACQIDIFPTIMGFLKIPYTNNTLGINLFNEKRDFSFFVSDNHLGCTNQDYFYCINISTKQEFLYKIGNSNNIINENPSLANDMKEYAISMECITKNAIKKGWTKPLNSKR